jgi:hypothetical protein
MICRASSINRIGNYSYSLRSNRKVKKEELYKEDNYNTYYASWLDSLFLQMNTRFSILGGININQFQIKQTQIKNRIITREEIKKSKQIENIDYNYDITGSKMGNKDNNQSECVRTVKAVIKKINKDEEEEDFILDPLSKINKITTKTIIEKKEGIDNNKKKQTIRFLPQTYQRTEIIKSYGPSQKEKLIQSQEKIIKKTDSSYEDVTGQSQIIINKKIVESSTHNPKEKIRYTEMIKKKTNVEGKDNKTYTYIDNKNNRQTKYSVKSTNKKYGQPISSEYIRDLNQDNNY